MDSTKSIKRTKIKHRVFSSGSGIDIPFLTIVLLLLSIGLVMLFSSSYAYALYHDKDSYFYIKRQVVFAIVGLVAMFVISYFDYRNFNGRLMWICLAVSYALLAISLVMPSKTGIKRWIYIGSFSFQPSEFTKFAVILFLAFFGAKYYDKMRTFKYGIAPAALVVGTTCAFVIVQKHLSATIIILTVSFVMLYVSGIKKWYFLAIPIVAIGLLYIVYCTNILEYTRARFTVWLDPFSTEISSDVSHQTRQSLYAIGSGGLFGLGLGNSRQKYLYLPEPQNDFIFAIVCEELGFIGAVIIILLFAGLVWRGFVIAMKAPDRFGAFLALGLTLQIGIQAFFNMAVVSNLVPNTGIGLPFFSYGGTSMMMLLAQMGVVLNISRHTKNKE